MLNSKWGQVAELISLGVNKEKYLCGFLPFLRYALQAGPDRERSLAGAQLVEDDPDGPYIDRSIIGF
jgi:hypothetical protein